jgi:type I restriction enzyme S subunit
MFQRQVETAWTFGTQPNIGMGALENLWVTLPPKSEQLEIVRYIENQINSFNNVTTKIQSEVAF